MGERERERRRERETRGRRRERGRRAAVSGAGEEEESTHAQTHLSLQSAAESLTSVLEQTSTWSNFSQEETSALATVILESVKSSTLAAFLKPSANVTQTVQTEHLGKVARLHLGAAFEGGRGQCYAPWLSRTLLPPTVSNLRAHRKASPRIVTASPIY